MPDQPLVVRIDPELAELIPTFLKNRQADVSRLEAMAAAGDADGARKLGHNLKGCGGGYGFEQISDIGARIEACAKGGDLSGLPALRAELADYLARIEVRYD